MHSLVQPNAWVALKLPSGNLRVLQVTPNTTISLGKYGSFPSNLIIHRPFHLTYELQDKRPEENFNRLRIVPASELYSDILASDTSASSPEGEPPIINDDEDAEASLPAGIEYSLVDPDSGTVVARTNRAELNAEARQTLSAEEIEALKKDGTDAGRDIIAKLLLSHTAIDQKTEYALAKYKILKTKKYIRRFCVVPMDVPMLTYWQLEVKDSTKILDMRDEMIALVGCWGNVHFSGEDRCENEGIQESQDPNHEQDDLEDTPGRWLAVDDTGGLLVAAMAERMGILYQPENESTNNGNETTSASDHQREHSSHQESITKCTDLPLDKDGEHGNHGVETTAQARDTAESTSSPQIAIRPSHGDGKPRVDNMKTSFAHSNTLTVIHANQQPNLSFLREYGFDSTNPAQTQDHPLASHLMTISWLQLVEPELDPTYTAEFAHVAPEILRTWKPNRRGNYYRKRRRCAKIRHIVDTTRKGEFSGLVVASTMDPISIMRYAVPLLAGGAPIAIYSQSIEPLTALADCYSIARRGAWVATPPDEIVGKTPEELEHWPGNEEFPLNPSLVLGATLQTSRVRKWQVLPSRTHPLMTSRGGAEGYVFTAWKVKPAEGKVEARGKARTRKRKLDETTKE
ncbi:Gcd10p family-domain-containing protein [Annulohypoxylon maeteangense]|uniref:Gcd10p family-domain-containing protein n=1 Tax=Annulohypoxylon maeteangense TaxID=1927788 RepID=UPI0020074893|nr:Gcd10p family-domain-containing protein [Annulohypoxylon maeteangense]KAI0882595.1 Gcd10p family-domain-containing protein [Annulohypoxylon maeteangense]